MSGIKQVMGNPGMTRRHSAKMLQNLAQIEVVDVPNLRKGSMNFGHNSSGSSSTIRYTVPQDKSVIFCDAHTREVVLVVLRDVVSNQNVKREMAEISQEVTKCRYSDEYKDKHGYTNPAVKERRETVLGFAEGMVSLLWHIILNRLPAGVFCGYDTARGGYILPKKLPPPKMYHGDTNGTFTFGVNGQSVLFCIEDSVEEDNSHSTPLSLHLSAYRNSLSYHGMKNDWTIAYAANNPARPSSINNLFLEDYGIVVLPASNTVTAWRTRLYRGPRLHDMVDGLDRLLSSGSHHSDYQGSFSPGSSHGMARTAVVNRSLRKRKRLGPGDVDPDDDVDQIPSKKIKIEPYA